LKSWVSKEYSQRGKELTDMSTAAKAVPGRALRAKVTSKGQITIPVGVRRSLGVKPGDHLRFEQQEGGFRLVRDAEENVFEKWRGIGVPGMAPGREGLRAYMRELRGYDEYDDSLA
jgi:AbrB family looped-hinge helix DNA binding protein